MLITCDQKEMRKHTKDSILIHVKNVTTVFNMGVKFINKQAADMMSTVYVLECNAVYSSKG
jgi:hypothetical protein